MPSSTGSGGSRGRPPEGRDSHGERDPSGWRIRPGPDGRGGPPPQNPRFLGPGFVTLFLLLLVLSMVLTASLRGTVAQPRVRIPDSPTFLTQVEDGNVSSIATKGTGVQGKFRQRVQYPDAAASPATEFVTEIPAFANSNQLMAQLQKKGVVINASSPSAGSSVLVTLLFTFGPVFLFVGLFVWLMRRGGGLGGADVDPRHRTGPGCLARPGKVRWAITRTRSAIREPSGTATAGQAASCMTTSPVVSSGRPRPKMSR